ncbi:ShlB/FhaC/HecB family hemolysin secretion/activation protein [Paraburkholderia phenoliruptrix]|uniref:ShlB/FhaC/HecB family hemolysin secretion/activation protein n=1 Tax=Paraburkholderia phenoliruptrix TaxID=252970 RepID=UPI001C6DFFEF|nr:ShlB/FhaC/HecB family hemolysin secretion/activation protein [Paraburkholderia phenoliruptrix]MBW9104363.1 ShlB/FhaC/HecB family hemolysin secretion/activation protein [Paraburkholderia phenoliruptrix]MBW9128582.1 ShlB/FhaC/HecB family hemolysin secretion/activation protein [Paraburkholderia ginsengiterrae]
MRWFKLAPCVVFALYAGAAVAQAWRDVAPQPAPPTPRSAPSQPSAPSVENATQIAVGRLEGLVFEVAGTTEPSTATQARVTAAHLPVLDAAFLHRFDSDIGKPLTFSRLAEIRRAVVERYRAAGKPLVDVYVPEQDVSAGVVHIAVAEFRLGEVRTSGNRYFSDDLLKREMPLEAGGPILQSDVSLGLAVLNANPYRHVDAVFAPGQAANSTDVILQTDDRLPLRVNAGYDNAGVRDLGRDRFFAGIDYGNLFGLDQHVAYQFTASNDFFSGNPDIEGRANRARFLAHALSYIAPLPWHDSIELFGVYAQSTPRLPDSYGQTGISAQMSVRYDWRLPTTSDTAQLVQFGYDFKRSNNDLEFGGFQVFNSNTHVHQFLLTYDLSKPGDAGAAHASATLVASPGGLDGSNSDTAFDAARHGATARYAYLQIAAQRAFALGAGFTLNARGTFQWTPNTLLPSEEMGLGGESSVRGYEPYVVLGDRGWNVQTELRTPVLPFGVSGAAAQPFVFVDAGHVWNRIDQPAEAGNASLVSVGAGVRFQWSRFVDFRCTYGVPLRAPTPGASKAPMVLLFVSIGT